MPDFEPFSCVNGREDAALSTLDRGLAYGDGLFETMRLERGSLPFWHFHRRRLLRDCERLRICADAGNLDRMLANFLASVRERGVARGVVKLIATRGEAGRGYQPPDVGEVTAILSVFPYPSYPRRYGEEGVKVFLCEHRLPHNPALAGMKHLNKLDYVLAAMEWRDSDCQEGLLLDQDNNVIEAGSRNLFVVDNGVLLTPLLDNAGVAGILRERIVEDYAKRMGTVVEESTLTLETLLAADEVFLGNSVLGVWPVRSLLGGAFEEVAVQCPRDSVGGQIHQLYEEDIQTRAKQHVA
ncbi:MAG: aminodeoxychorismate lyase [Cellvibrionaceae bacterium]